MTSPLPGAFAVTLVLIVLLSIVIVAIDCYRWKRRRDKETDDQLRAGLKKLVELGYVIERENGYVPTVSGLRYLEKQQ